MDFELRNKIREEIKEHGITETAYANIFCYLNVFRNATTGCFDFNLDKENTVDKQMQKVCDLVRETVNTEWNESIISFVIPKIVIEEINTRISTMESWISRRKILEQVYEMMYSGKDNLLTGKRL